MNDIGIFIVHAIQLERDAARRYEDLAACMGTAGNREVEQFFRRMSEFSRRHLKEAMSRGGFHALPQIAAADFQWPEGVSPEAAGWTGVDGFIDRNTALQLALDGERASVAFYSTIAATSQDAEVKAMAADFAAEETEHVNELEKWIARVAI